MDESKTSNGDWYDQDIPEPRPRPLDQEELDHIQEIIDKALKCTRS